MKVLHINHSDIGGGASIGAYRFHRGLIDLGVDSRLLVKEALISDPLTTVLPRMWCDKELVKWGKRLGFKCIAPQAPFKVLDMPVYRQADIVHVHNLHSGFFNLNFFLRCNKPIVWTIHDMWPFTGDCIYCNSCNCWDDSPGSPYRGKCVADCQCIRDNARHAPRERSIKKRIYDRSNITVACPSNWLVQHVSKSILGGKAIHHIPYGINTNAYAPLDKATCRDLLGIPRQKKVMLNVAEALGDRRKGADLMASALANLPPYLKAQSVLVTMGRTAGSLISSIEGLETRHLGYVGDDRLKTIVYSASDLFVMPTRADTFGIVLQESMACRTPVVAFRVGGVTDPVRHNETGLLAEPENAEDLSAKIVQMLTQDDERSRMAARGRDICVREYDYLVVAQQYLDVYDGLLQSNC
jgi:glycosyltransferase involved in cell wall biosynthesis